MGVAAYSRMWQACHVGYGEPGSSEGKDCRPGILYMWETSTCNCDSPSQIVTRYLLMARSLVAFAFWASQWV